MPQIIISADLRSSIPVDLLPESSQPESIIWRVRLIKSSFVLMLMYDWLGKTINRKATFTLGHCPKYLPSSPQSAMHKFWKPTFWRPSFFQRHGARRTWQGEARDYLEDLPPMWDLLSVLAPTCRYNLLPIHSVFLHMPLYFWRDVSNVSNIHVIFQHKMHNVVDYVLGAPGPGPKVAGIETNIAR